MCRRRAYRPSDFRRDLTNVGQPEERMTQTEVGRRLGLSRGRVQQIEAEALAKLWTRLEPDLLAMAEEAGVGV